VADGGGTDDELLGDFRVARAPATAVLTIRSCVNRSMKRRVIEGANSVPPSATVRTAVASCSGECP
jgi:hypothetical protein